MKYTYKTIDTRSISGLKEAEKLHKSGKWKIVSVGFYEITFEKLISK